MDIVTKKIYINGYFYMHLQSGDLIHSRPELHRHHEHSLWTVYQVLKAGGNQAIIMDKEKGTEKEIFCETEFMVWVAEAYPGFENQLDKKVYTSHPHPLDKI